MHELDVLRRVGRHPNITRCVAFIDDPKKQKVYLLFDFEPGGLLCKTEGSREVFDESRVRSAARDVVAALSHVHARGVVYRDLKAENCLLGADGRVVLCDFGLAYVCPSVNGTQDDTLTASVGTRMYQAPESLDGKPYSGKLADGASPLALRRVARHVRVCVACVALTLALLQFGRSACSCTGSRAGRLHSAASDSPTWRLPCATPRSSCPRHCPPSCAN